MNSCRGSCGTIALETIPPPMLSQNHRYIVRTIWGGGRNYRLTASLYYVYKLYSALCWLLITLLAVISIFVKADRIGPLTWPHGLPFILALIVCVLGIVGQIGIATRGAPTTERTGSGHTPLDRVNRGFIRSYSVVRIILCSILVLMALVTIVFQFMTANTINAGAIFLLFIGLVGCITAALQFRPKK